MNNMSMHGYSCIINEFLCQLDVNLSLSLSLSLSPPPSLMHTLHIYVNDQGSLKRVNSEREADTKRLITKLT